MTSSLINSQIKAALGPAAISALKGLGEIAAKQGGETVFDNYKLLGKRAIIVVGIAAVSVQIATFVIGTAIARKNEEKRIERVVQRMLEEERQKQESDQQ